MEKRTEKLLEQARNAPPPSEEERRESRIRAAHANLVLSGRRIMFEEFKKSVAHLP